MEENSKNEDGPTKRKQKKKNEQHKQVSKTTISKKDGRPTKGKQEKSNKNDGRPTKRKQQKKNECEKVAKNSKGKNKS